VPALPVQDPQGGFIVRNENGVPTGVLVGTAMRLITDHIPPYDEKVLLDALGLAIHECNRLGLTGIHDAGVSLSDIELFKQYLLLPFFASERLASLFYFNLIT